MRDKALSLKKELINHIKEATSESFKESTKQMMEQQKESLNLKKLMTSGGNGLLSRSQTTMS